MLDEADHMADLGFLPAVTRILDATPAGGQRLLFSATLDRDVDRLVHRYLSDPAIHAVAPAVSAVESMDHQVFTITKEDKVAVAAEIAARSDRTLFFVRTKHGADRLAKQLGRAGVAALAIHGNLNQNQRQRALDEFSSGRTRVLVATDVAARGIHVDDVGLVVHFDPANDSKGYLHRSGRRARAGAAGTACPWWSRRRSPISPACTPARPFDRRRPACTSVTRGARACRSRYAGAQPAVQPPPGGGAPPAGHPPQTTPPYGEGPLGASGRSR